VIGEPPSVAGADQASVTLASPAVAAVIVGAAGAVTAAACGVAERSFDGVLSPAALLAVTRYQYVVPFVSPVSVKLVAVPTVASRVSPPLDVPR
jgi:hypothetical protein